jgi:hypothetical protein
MPVLSATSAMIARASSGLCGMKIGEGIPSRAEILTATVMCVLSPEIARPSLGSSMAMSFHFARHVRTSWAFTPRTSQAAPAASTHHRGGSKVCSCAPNLGE